MTLLKEGMLGIAGHGRRMGRECFRRLDGTDAPEVVT